MRRKDGLEFMFRELEAVRSNSRLKTPTHVRLSVVVQEDESNAAEVIVYRYIAVYGYTFLLRFTVFVAFSLISKS
jgi:hypothetical protein